MRPRQFGRTPQAVLSGWAGFSGRPGQARRPPCPLPERDLEKVADRSGAELGETLSQVLYAASAGAAVLGALLMMRRWSLAFAYRSGTALFVLLSLVLGFNVIDLSAERLPAWAIQISGMLTSAVFPTAWLYLRDLTSDTPRPLNRRDARHFLVPVLFAVHVIWAFAFLSPRSEASLWGVGEMDAAARVFGGTGVVLQLAWIGQISVYSWFIARELLRLPGRLRRAFASMSGRDLAGLRGLGGLVLAHLVIVVLASLGLIAVPETVFALLGLALTFGLAGFAVAQAPVFQLTPDAPRRVEPGVVNPLPPVPTSDGGAASEKYVRSLLDEERLTRIANRIHGAFANEALHLDPNLSLSKLSERVGVSENHLSQTFTRKIGESFFDFVNTRRIEAAKALLAESDDSVVDIAIAVGFNSRSAFYKAFNAFAAMTPAAFREAARAAGP